MIVLLELMNQIENNAFLVNLVNILLGLLLNVHHALKVILIFYREVLNVYLVLLGSIIGRIIV